MCGLWFLGPHFYHRRECQRKVGHSAEMDGGEVRVFTKMTRDLADANQCASSSRSFAGSVTGA